MSDYDQRAFDRLCDKIEEVNGCYEYQGAITDTGYGFFWYKDTNEYAHRIAWLLYKGEIPAGMLILHKCDNRKCINVDHLFLGTHKDNTLDMIAKGRNPRQGLGGKITKEIALSIKQELLLGTMIVEIARQYNTTRGIVSNIKRNKAWSWLDGTND